MIEERKFKDKFTLNFLRNELDHLKIFYAVGPERNYQMMNELNLSSPIIPQDKLDDYQVLLGARRN